MCKNSISKLIEIIKEDISILIKNIQEKESSFEYFISESKKNRDLLTISFSYFLELLNKYSFNYEKLPLENSNFDFLGNRWNLFNEVFITTEYINLEKRFIFYYFNIVESFHKPIVIFYLLYYRIFIEFFLLSRDISIIFNELLSKWKNSFREQKFLVTFIIPIPIFLTYDTFSIDENIQIRYILAHHSIDKLNIEELNSKYYFQKFIDGNYDFDPLDDYLDLVGNCLFFNTKLSFIYLKKNNKDDVLKLKNEFNEKESKIIELINTFYLFGANFKYRKYTIELPWWFISPLNKFKRISKDTSLWGESLLKEENKEDFFELYEKVVKSKIFVSSNYRMIIRRYHQIFNRDNYADIILDTFIILEWLFTRKTKAELAYRLSLNIALFISSNWREFKQNNNFINDLYNLRSSIIHGGSGIKEVNKIFKKYNLKDPRDVIKELKSILNEIIIRLVNLLIKDHNILKKFDDKHFFFESSKVFKTDL
ncbi:MAG: hypothetical protein KGD63_07475 [Candidatus Lokiarchaeota archaeon]|nr:hypothetical protein [Candidatus Lokiarchaeota archaeon]